jgi:DNA-binding GntR family transcriptional regulator
MDYRSIAGLHPDRAPRRSRTTADYVADALRAAIQRGDLCDGVVLNQAALARQFGVSRLPVREAMRALQAEGLVERRAYRLAIVRRVEVERLVEVHELLALLEGFIIGRAVGRIDRDRLDQARRVSDRMREETDRARWLALDAQFRHTLYAPANAHTALELVEQLTASAGRYGHPWNGGAAEAAELCEQRDQIIRLLARGDGAGAQAAVKRHATCATERMHASSVRPTGDAGPGPSG